MNNEARHIFGLLAIILVAFGSQAQSQKEAYEQFRNEARSRYENFRDDCNKRYADFLRRGWDWYEGHAALPLPIDEHPVPPRPYDRNDRDTTVIEITPTNPLAGIEPQPLPVAPVRETPGLDEETIGLDFYGITAPVRMPRRTSDILGGLSFATLADTWELLSREGLMNNAIRDCLETRIRHNLCDWAYLDLLRQLGLRYCSDSNSASFLTAYLYCQSGYQMRLARVKDKLVLLFGSLYQIYGREFYEIDGVYYYALDDLTGDGIELCNAAFENEQPMSLAINDEQRLGTTASDVRIIATEPRHEVMAESQVPLPLIEFYGNYPVAVIDDNPMTRWALYAATPIAATTSQRLYPALRQAIAGRSQGDAVGILLGWVQTGFEYEYDDKIWGGDRAFFAEETLYYPYCDCEDRAILFSRLVRDLLGLDVALIYYPGHLAAAVCFDEEVGGDAMMIGGRRFTVCDPTYIGAPVGARMPSLEYDKTQAIVLSR